MFRKQKCLNQQSANLFYHLVYTLNFSFSAIQCVECFFSTHCLEDNSCESGTSGPTCEGCSRLYTDHAALGAEFLMIVDW